MAAENNKKFSWRLGEILVQKGWITWEQLEQALSEQGQAQKYLEHVLSENRSAAPEHVQMLNLGEILVQNGWISWDTLKAGLEVQRSTGVRIGNVLLDRKMVKEDDLYHALAIQHGKIYVDFNQVQVPREVISRVPRRLAEDFEIMPLLFQDQIFLLTLADPEDAGKEKELEKMFPGYSVRSTVSSPGQIRRAIESYYGRA